MQLASCEFPASAAAARRPGAAAPFIRRRLPSTATTTPAALLTVTKNKRPAAAVRCHCSSRSRGRDDYDAEEFGCDGGRLVDEEMHVLRRRIHEMRAAERNWEPPEEWAAWEKEWYATTYDDDVYDLLCALQAFLVGSRPGVGVGLLAVLVLAVPASAFVLLTHLLDASRAIISNLQH